MRYVRRRQLHKSYKTSYPSYWGNAVLSKEKNKTIEYMIGLHTFFRRLSK